MAREDLDNLLSACIPFAQQMLAKHGTFFPFGCTLSPVGEISLVGCYDESGVAAEEIPALIMHAESADWIIEGFRDGARAGDYKAVALCVDVQVDAPVGSGKTDAIRVSLEENDGEAVNVFLPYRRRLLRGIKYGELFASAADHVVFV